MGKRKAGGGWEGGKADLIRLSKINALSEGDEMEEDELHVDAMFLTVADITELKFRSQWRAYYNHHLCLMKLPHS